MTRDTNLPIIFNPQQQQQQRNRTPSVVITNDGGLSGVLNNNNNNHHHHCESNAGTNSHVGPSTQTIPPSGCTAKLKRCSAILCATSAKKIYFGIWVTTCMTISWVGATHCIKYLFLRRMIIGDHTVTSVIMPVADLNRLNVTTVLHPHEISFDAAFFTTWFVTTWTAFFFPLYMITRWCANRQIVLSDILSDIIRNFRDKGFTLGSFMSRCGFFCLLWVFTNYMYILSLRILLATDVMALFSTSVSFVYLLSWVVLHEQFVGIRIMAVIICDTGVALLAYMDGITGTPTLSGVVLAATAAAGSAIYKVLFKKMIGGDATYGQIAILFSLIGLLNAILLWPIFLTFYLVGFEHYDWQHLQWPILVSASALFLVANLLSNFSIAFTYDSFITLGLITAIPLSASLDILLYGAQFEGMKLAGMILIVVGFFLVMLPNNWPDYIIRLLRNIILITHSARWGRSRYKSPGNQRRDVVDYRTGYIRSHLRSPSGRVR